MRWRCRRIIRQPPPPPAALASPNSVSYRKCLLGWVEGPVRVAALPTTRWSITAVPPAARPHTVADDTPAADDTPQADEEAMMMIATEEQEPPEQGFRVNWSRPSTPIEGWASTSFNCNFIPSPTLKPHTATDLNLKLYA